MRFPLIWLFHIAMLSSSALAEDFSVGVGESIQLAINEAVPGDTITIAAGTYDENLSTEIDGESGSPITVKSDGEGEVIITTSGEVLQVDHSHWRFIDLIFDGQYGTSDVLDINDSAHFLVLDNVEVRRSGRDCIDMGAPSYVEIKNSLIHHCLHYDDDEEVRVDAHGITGGAVQNLTITDTDIHTFSGDGIQFDPGRSDPGWNNITILRSRIWLEPLTEDTHGFSAGTIPGENAVDTKTFTGGDRATLTIKDCEMWGFQDGMDFSNQAALLLKENVDVTVSRTLIRDSEIGLRVRGPTIARPEGAHVSVDNSLIYNVTVGVRYEDDVENLFLTHITMGADIETALEEVDSEAGSPVVKNSLFFGDTLPVEAETGSNGVASADDFEDASSHDYHLVASSAAIDAGTLIEGMETDFDGAARTHGEAPDQGAFEFGGALPDTGMGGDTGDTEDTEDPADDDDTDTPPTDTGLSSDTGLSADDGAQGGGIGAAESVGEKGGCGCSQTRRSPFTYGPWLLMWASMLLMRRRA